MTKCFRAFWVGLICSAAIFSLASADDQFAVAIGTHNQLVVFGPKGERITELALATVGQPVTVGDVSVQVSFGTDSKGRLTAILAPSAETEAEFRFNVLGKSVDVNKGVVTLIFSSDFKRVTINAGVGGSVEVNSHRLRPTEPLP
ncbi:MAG TPA: hypothetical protein VGZ93_04850 [Candidatus Methylacidiphilales bacterium]|jgi:hypothetical protein|nr:hypothetical protein [Candidatus Methylacidiphilales bacterium]